MAARCARSSGSATTRVGASAAPTSPSSGTPRSFISRWTTRLSSARSTVVSFSRACPWTSSIAIAAAGGQAVDFDKVTVPPARDDRSSALPQFLSKARPSRAATCVCFGVVRRALHVRRAAPWRRRGLCPSSACAAVQIAHESVESIEFDGERDEALVDALRGGLGSARRPRPAPAQLEGSLDRAASTARSNSEPGLTSRRLVIIVPGGARPGTS